MTKKEAYDLGYRMGYGTASEEDAQIEPLPDWHAHYVCGYESGRAERLAEEARALRMGFEVGE